MNGGLTWQTSSLFINLPPALYLIELRNADNTCSVELPIVELFENVAPVITDVEYTNPTDCDINDGTLTILANAGSFEGSQTNIEYSINGGVTWSSNPEFINLPSGTFVILARNEGGTCEVSYNSEFVAIQSPEAPVIKEVETEEVSDCGESDGSLTVTVLGDPINFRFGIVIEGQTDTIWQVGNNVFTNLNSGVYHIFAENLDGSCMACYLSAEILELNEPVINEVNIIPISDCESDDARIEIIAESDNAIEYTVDNGLNWQSSNTFLFLEPGSYNVGIRNADNSCVVFDSNNPVVIQDLEAPSLADVLFVNPAQCDIDNGFIEIVGVDSLVAYEYSIDGVNWTSNNIFENLPGGSYNVLIRNENGTCGVAYENNPIILTPPLSPMIVNVIANDPSDCNVLDGTIQIYAQGGNQPLKYSIDNGTTFQDSPNFINLDSGIYQVVVANNNESCPIIWSPIELLRPNEPLINAVVSTIPTGCGEEDATININASSTSPLLYSIDSGDTYQQSNLFANLPGGNYDVWVANFGGICPVNYGNVEIISPQVPIIENPIDDVSNCQGESSPISIAINQTIGSYSISGSGSYLNDEIIGGDTLNFDAYLNGQVSNFTVEITSQNGCSITEQFNVVRAGDPISDFLINLPNCANEIIEINFTGEASVGAILNWDIPDGDIVYQSNATDDSPANSNIHAIFSETGPITISLLVDDGGCTDNSTQNIFIGSTAPDILANIQENSSCIENNGGIDITVEANTPFQSNYSYSWNGPNGFTSSDEDPEGLAVGVYSVTVYDQFTGCTQQEDFEVTQGPAMDIVDIEIINSLSCEDPTGSINVEVYGGLPPYAVLLTKQIDGNVVTVDIFSSYENELQFNDLDAAIYSISIDDASGCGEISLELPLDNVIGPEVEIANIFLPICGESNGSFDIIVQSENAPFTFNLYNESFVTSLNQSIDLSGSSTVSNLTSGEYYIEIIDANGCVSTSRIELPCDEERCDFSGVVEDIIQISDCNVEDGSISLTNLPAGTTAMWTDSNGNEYQGFEITGLGAGFYTVFLEENGCTEERQYLINAPTNLEVDINSITHVECAAGIDGGIKFVVRGPIGDYQYTIVGAGVTNQFAVDSEGTDHVFNEDGLFAGDYFILVEDLDSDCSNYFPFTIEQNEALEIMISPSPATNCYASNGFIELEAEGAFPPYSLINLDGEVVIETFVSEAIIEGLRDGNYEYIIQDANGCGEFFTVDLGIVPSCTDTIDFIIPFETDTIVCLDNILDIPGNLVSTEFCAQGNSVEVSSPHIVDNCLAISSAEDFVGFAEEPICVIHCFEYEPSIVACDTSLIFATVLPPMDTVYLDLLYEESAQYCIPSNLLQYNQEYSSVSYCSEGNDESVYATNFNENCFTINAADDFAGVTEEPICVVTCYHDDVIFCDTTIIITNVIFPACDLELNLIELEEASCAFQDGEIRVLALGGLGELSYEWSDGLNDSDTAINLPVGDHSVTVTDLLTNCSVTETYTVENNDTSIDFEISSENSICETPNGAIYILVTQGQSPYEVEYTGPVSDIIENIQSEDIDIQDLAPGQYNFTVKDNYGCSLSYSYIISATPSDLSIINTGTVNQDCGQQNGTASFIVDNFNNNYSVSINGQLLESEYSESNIVISNLAIGNYNILVTDQYGCSTVTSFGIGENDFEITEEEVTISQPSCINANDGQIIANTQEVYTVRRTNGAIVGQTPIYNLEAGNYIIFKETGDCSASMNISLIQPDAITANFEVQPESCAGDDGLVSIIVTGGEAPFLLTWNDGFEGATRNAMQQGIYAVTITDQNNCHGVISEIIVEGCEVELPQPDTVDILIPYEAVTEYCLNEEVFEYPFEPTFSAFCFQGLSNQVAASTLDELCFTLAPADGFSGSISTPICVVQCYFNELQICDTTFLNVTVQEPDCELTIENPIVNHTLCGNNNGIIEVSTQGGTLPLSYNWSPNVSSTNQANNLSAGMYSVTVQDSIGCQVTTSIEINASEDIEVELLPIDATCQIADGSITVNIQSVSVPYTIVWSGSASGSLTNVTNNQTVIQNLDQGLYSVNVIDSNGCSINNNVTIDSQESDITFELEQLTQPNCGQEDGSILVNIDEEIENYSISINGEFIADNVLGNFTIENLSAGNYVVEIESNGCTSINSITLADLDAPEIELLDLQISNVSCSSGDNGLIQSADNTIYEVYRQGALLGLTPQNNLIADTYTVSTLNQDCHSSIEVTLTQPVAMTISVNKIPETCEHNNGRITAAVTGGVSPYIYQWSNQVSGNINNNLSAGTYDVTVTDDNGCVAFLEDISLSYLCDSDPCDPILSNNDVSVQQDDDGNFFVCLEFNEGEIEDYEIFINENIYNDPEESCRIDTIISYSYALVFQQLNNGPYTVEWLLNGNLIATSVDNSQELLDWIVAQDPQGQWEHEADDFSFKGRNQVANYGLMKVTHQLTQIRTFIQVNYTTIYSGNRINLNDDQPPFIVIVDPNSDCNDTLNIDYGVIDDSPLVNNCTDFLSDEFVTIQADHCDFSEFYCTELPIQQILEYTITDNGQNFDGQYSGCDYQSIYRYNYFNLPGFGANGPYSISDWEIEDQTFSGTFQTINGLLNLINGWDPEGNWRIDPYSFNIIGGVITSTYGMMNITQTQSGYNTMVSPFIGLQATFGSISLETGDHELIFTHYLSGCADTVRVSVECPINEVQSATETERITYTIEEGNYETLCIETDELNTNLVSLHNNCESQDDDIAFVEPSGLDCITIEAANPGTTRACIVICDNNNLCDTTLVDITVNEILQPNSPDRGQSEVTTIEQANLANDNDELPIDPQRNITILSGFSPNGDGINDNLIIRGLERYPNHALKVFNRRGNLVFQTTNYQNDWSGQANGADLPGGTYFYVLQSGEGQSFTGYIHIER